MTTRFATTLLALSACAGRPAAPPAPKEAPPIADASTPDVVLDAGDPVDSLEALAARGAVETPLMREAHRIEDATKPLEMRLDRDTCVRALFASSRPVGAWIEDEGKAPRGDVAAPSTSSLVPPKGPACGRKGEVLRLVIDGGAGPMTARAVVWQAP